MAGKLKSFLATAFGGSRTSEITEADQADAMADGLSVQTLYGSEKHSARARQQIFQARMDMIGDPVISTALRLLVTAALGGNETSGNVVFIESEAKHKDDAKGRKLVEELQADLTDIFNKIAYTVAFNAAGYGDGFGRIYSKDGQGVVSVDVDELVHPSMIIPYEQGSRTVGFVAAAAAGKYSIRLGLHQMARLKMPRMVYTPQTRAVDKAIRTSLEQDDIDLLPKLPAQIGGSFLEGVEGQYQNWVVALAGLVGQRALDSIDESMLTVNMQNMTKPQQKTYMESMRAILTGAKKRAEDAVKSGKPFLQRVYHLIPTWGDKQMTAISGSLSGSGRSGSGNISIDDVLFHAKLLCGAIGVDFSMLGFADMLSGGLGDGGFFRTSAQVAERARFLRVGLTEFFNSIIDVHTFRKHSVVYAPGDRPWAINFYGSISALEAESQATRTEAMNTATSLAQLLAQLKDVGLSPATVEEILTKIAKLEESLAKLVAADLKKAPEGMQEFEGAP